MSSSLEESNVLNGYTLSDIRETCDFNKSAGVEKDSFSFFVWSSKCTKSRISLTEVALYKMREFR